MNETSLSLPIWREVGRAQTVGTPQAYPSEDRDGNPIGGLVTIIRRRLYLVVGVFIAVLAAGAGVTMLQKPKYSATAQLMINPNPDQVVPEKQALASTRVDGGRIDSEIEVLKSPALAARLADELDLGADPEWNSALGQANPSSDAAGSGAYDGIPTSLSESAGTASGTPEAPDAVVANVSDAIDVRRRGLSYVIEVTAKAGSADRAAQIANTLADIYLRSLAEARYEVSEKANQWLKDRLDELRDEVQVKQAAAQAYRAQRNLLTAQGVSLVERQIADVQSSLLRTRAEYAQKQAEATQLTNLTQQSNPSLLVDGPAGTTDSMRDLRSKEAEMAQKVADLESRYGQSHPALLQAKDEQAAVMKQVKAEVDRIANASRLEAQALGARLSAEQGDLDSLHRQLVSSNFDEVRLRALETDAEAARSVYESFLQRYHEVARQGNLASVEARLLSFARPPGGPTSPNLLFNAALTLAAGLALALLAGLLAEQFRGTVETTEEVERRVGARALVAVPALHRRHLRRLPKRERHPAGYLVTKRMSPFAEALRVLQASILLSSQPSPKVIAITSALPAEGKTTLSIGLARIAALGGQKVIVVDCDVRMRSLNKLLGIDPKDGLQQVLAGEQHWKSVVACDRASGAHVLPAAGPGAASKDMFGSRNVQKLLAELGEHYDLVVLDCAPVFAVADTRLVASLADAVVVTARTRRTPVRALAAAIQQLEIGGARVLGVALNRVATTGPRRSFYDGLYYSKAFSGYYAKEA